MRKLFPYVSLIAMVAVVVAGTGTALAHKNGKGKGHKGPHGAFVMNAKLASVTGPTGATGGTGVVGKVRSVQNRKKVVFSGHLRGLVPAGAYSVSLYADTDGNGCASTGNALLNPPAFKPVTANGDGNGNTKAKVSIGTFALDKTADYYVAALDATGATVACGDLVLKKKPKKEKKK